MRAASRWSLINRAMAKRFWPDENPIDRRVRTTAGLDSASWLRIVGVVEDVHHVSLSRDPVTEMYRPDRADGDADLHARRPNRPRACGARRVGARRGAGASIPNLPIYDVRTMEDRIAGSFAQTRGTMLLLLVTAALAAALSGVAIYGSIWYSVSQRIPEIGVRLALGASRASVFVDVLRRAAWLTGIGVAIGVGGALAGSRLIAGLLFDTRATDPATLAAVVAATMGLAVDGGHRARAARDERRSDDRAPERVGRSRLAQKNRRSPDAAYGCRASTRPCARGGRGRTPPRGSRARSSVVNSSRVVMRHSSARSGASDEHLREPGRDLDADAPRVERRSTAAGSQPLAGRLRAIRRFHRQHRRHRRGAAQPLLDSRVTDAPLGHEAIRRIAPVQRARRFAVHVDLVLLGDDAELGEVEVRVHRLHRVVGPLDQVEPHRERALALQHASADSRRRRSRNPSSTPAMCDHCVGLPCLMPATSRRTRSSDRPRTRRSGCRRASR